VKLQRIPARGGTPPDEATIRRELARDGFEAFSWSDPPGRTYEPHSHDHDESICVLRGAIVFGIAGREYALGPGDRLMLPEGTVHVATAGPDGATYLIGERSSVG
jgi:quercetin dioxygenase-like cupin family protein